MRPDIFQELIADITNMNYLHFMNDTFRIFEILKEMDNQFINDLAITPSGSFTVSEEISPVDFFLMRRLLGGIDKVFGTPFSLAVTFRHFILSVINRLDVERIETYVEIQAKRLILNQGNDLLRIIPRILTLSLLFAWNIGETKHRQSLTKNMKTLGSALLYELGLINEEKWTNLMTNEILNRHNEERVFFAFGICVFLSCLSHCYTSLKPESQVIAIESTKEILSKIDSEEVIYAYVRHNMPITLKTTRYTSIKEMLQDYDITMGSYIKSFEELAPFVDYYKDMANSIVAYAEDD